MAVNLQASLLARWPTCTPSGSLLSFAFLDRVSYSLGWSLTF